MRVAKELSKRLLSLVLVLFLVTLFSALLLSFVPGDPVDTLVPLAHSAEADALKAQGVMVDAKRIVLDEPLKTLGLAEVPVKLGRGVSAQIKVWVVKKE